MNYAGHRIFNGLLAACLYCCSSCWATTPTNLTATGEVFSDDNRNGQRDSGEKGVAQVAVSDGVRITHTDAEGHYLLTDISPAKSRFIFITTPAGYTAWNRFYCAVPSVPTNMTANFALWPSPAADKSVFKFAQITDVHVGNQGSDDWFVEDLREIEALGPDFIVNTGDLINGRRLQFDLYQSALRQARLPIVHVIGNHDREEYDHSDSTNYFEKFFGPTYYSFDYGRKHFVVLNCITATEEQTVWLSQDLAEQRSGGKDVLVFQHFPPDEKLMTILHEFKVQAIFSGHWHASRVVPCDGTLSVNTPPLCFGGIDLSPRGFRLITCRGDGLLIDYRYSGCKRLCALVAPAKAAVVAAGIIPIRVAFYDTTMPTVNVEYQWNNGPWHKMLPQNKFCWEARENCTSAGANQIKIKVRFDNEAVLERRSTFVVTADPFPMPKPGQDWPMFHGDGARKGVTREDLSPPLRLAWIRNLGGTIHISSPVVKDGTVYIGVADEENKGQAGIYALDGMTGAIKWRYATTNSIRHTVAVDEKHCYGATIDGIVLALDKATGKLIWQYSLGNEMERWCSRWVMVAPLVQDNVVYAGVAPFFVALNAATGQEIWRAPSMGSDFVSCLSSPACDAKSVYVGFNWGKGLFALDRKNGIPVWTNQHFSGYASPVLSGKRLYYYGNGMLRALASQSGACLWSNTEAIVSTSAVSDDKLVIGCRSGSVRAINAATGKTIWTRTRQSARHAKLSFWYYVRGASPIISSPAIAGKTVYYGGTDGQFTALDLETGKLLWSYDLGSPVTSSPAVSGNTVYIATFDGTVYAFTAIRR